MKIRDTIEMTNGIGNIDIEISTIPSGTPTPRTKGLPYGHSDDLKVGFNVQVTCGTEVLYGATARSHSQEEALDAILADLEKWIGTFSRVHEVAVRMRRILTNGEPQGRHCPTCFSVRRTFQNRVEGCSDPWHGPPPRRPNKDYSRCPIEFHADDCDCGGAAGDR